MDFFALYILYKVYSKMYPLNEQKNLNLALLMASSS